MRQTKTGGARLDERNETGYGHENRATQRLGLPNGVAASNSLRGALMKPKITLEQPVWGMSARRYRPQGELNMNKAMLLASAAMISLAVVSGGAGSTRHAANGRSR